MSKKFEAALQTIVGLLDPSLPHRGELAVRALEHLLRPMNQGSALAHEVGAMLGAVPQVAQCPGRDAPGTDQAVKPCRIS
jgi:hypothetical protein